VVLDHEGVVFFKTQANGKSPADPLFATADGKPWRRDQWAERIRSAIAMYNKDAQGQTRVPMTASAYSFRHARISELLQIHGVDPLMSAREILCALCVRLTRGGPHEISPSTAF